MTTEEIDRLVRTLDGVANKYYVYALCTNDMIPFYIGKGCGGRVLAHQDAADRARESIEADDTLSDAEKREKIARLTEKLKAILNQEQSLQMIIIKWGLTEDEAFMCESALINLIGLLEGKTLISLTNIVNGHASDAEKDSVADIKTKARTLDLFLKECAIPERGIESIEQNVAFIKINKLYPKCFEKDGNIDDYKVKECVRGIWPVHESRRERIQYIFALYRRRVVGVYHVTRVSKGIGEEYLDGLSDFPSYPTETRQMDRMLAQYASVEDAQAKLNQTDFEHFLARLQKEEKSEEQVLMAARRRVYFSVDDDVPIELLAYMDCLLTKDGTGEFLKSQWPVQYNF